MANPISEGRKDDAGKLEWSLLPIPPLREVLKVLAFGVKKYGRNNWVKVPNWRTRYYDAATRHLTDWYSSAPLDKETGLSHLAHAICCLLFLLALDMNQLPKDGD